MLPWVGFIRRPLPCGANAESAALASARAAPGGAGLRMLFSVYISRPGLRVGLLITAFMVFLLCDATPDAEVGDQS